MNRNIEVGEKTISVTRSSVNVGTRPVAATTTTSSKPTTIRNPYASKRPTGDTLDQNSGTSGSSTLLASQVDTATDGSFSRQTATSLTCNSRPEPPKTNENEPAVSCLDNKVLDDPSKGANDDKSAGPLVPKQASTKSGDLAYWERLPSRNLSFGSAEILTVTECIQHARLYQDRSVRVTGLLHHRCYLPGSGTEDVIVQLELKDPHLQSQTQQPHSRSSSTGTMNRGCSRGLSTSFNTVQPQRPSIGRRNRLSTGNRRLSTGSSLVSKSSLGSRKRPWFATTSSRTTNLSTGRRSSTGNTSTRTSLSITNSRSSTNAVSSKSSVLKVLVDPCMPHLDTAVVGSFVTVIGQVVAIDKGKDDINDDDDEDKESNEVEPRLQNPQLQPQNQEGTEPQVLTPVYKVNARLLQILPKNGSDMSLFQRALHARRKSMYQRYHHTAQSSSSSSSTGQPHPQKNHHDLSEAVSNTTETPKQQVLLLHGCGPPPYDIFQNNDHG